MYDSAEESEKNSGAVAQMRFLTVMMMTITGVLMPLFSLLYT